MESPREADFPWLRIDARREIRQNLPVLIVPTLTNRTPIAVSTNGRTARSRPVLQP